MNKCSWWSVVVKALVRVEYPAAHRGTASDEEDTRTGAQLCTAQGALEQGDTTRNSDTSTSIVMGGYIAPPGPYTLFTLVYRNISNVESRHASCGNASTKYKPSMHDALSIRKKFPERKKNL